MAKNEIAKVQNQFPTEVPDFLRKDGPARGAEEVTAQDLIIPRLEIIQALSPARKKNDPSYIEGAEEGMLFNNVTRQLYGTEVLVVPVYYTKQFLLWKDRKKSGGVNGFRGAFPTQADAEAAVRALPPEDADVEIADTAQHFCLLINGDAVEEIVLSMAKSKLKVSRRWNSLIRMNGNDSFSRVYRISGTTETNARNEEYYNLTVSNVGFVTPEIYRRAEALYEQIRSGTVRVSTDVDESTGTVDHDSEEF